MKSMKSWFLEHKTRLIALFLVFLLMLCSMTCFARKFTDPQTYSKTIQSIDEKKLSVLGVSAAIAGTSTLLASVPDDATTPLANELMDLSSYLVVVICVLVLEKSLLTVFGSVSCYILFPIACLFAMAFVIREKQIFISWAIKLSVLALALLCIVPVSMRISDYIYEINQVVIEQEVNGSDNVTEDESETEPEEDHPWYKKIWNSITTTVQDVAETVTHTAQKAIDSGKDALSKFTDAVSVFVIAYCAIPIFVVFLLLWLLKILFGINITIDVSKFNLNKIHRKHKEEMLP